MILRSKWVGALLALFTAACVSGCLSNQALQPIASQNATNISELGKSNAAMVSLLNDYVRQESFSVKRIYVQKFLKSIDDRVSAPLAADLWSTHITDPLDQSLLNLLAAGTVDPQSLNLAPNGMGWLITAARSPGSFSPYQADALCTQIRAFQTMFGDDGEAFLKQVEGLIVPVDPIYAELLKECAAAERTVSDLNSTATRQLVIAQDNSQSIQAFAQTKISAGETFGQILGSDEVKSLLNDVLDSQIADEAARKEAIDAIVSLSDGLRK